MFYRTSILHRAIRLLSRLSIFALIMVTIACGDASATAPVVVEEKGKPEAPISLQSAAEVSGMVEDVHRVTVEFPAGAARTNLDKSLTQLEVAIGRAATDGRAKAEAARAAQTTLQVLAEGWPVLSKGGENDPDLDVIQMTVELVLSRFSS
jgi:hypothetical protein